MIRAILFDMGGTLDGEGHWLDRFAALYPRFGLSVPWETLRAAFDAAESRAAVDEAIATAGIDAMVARHVDWQLEHLGVSSRVVRDNLIRGFVEPIRTATANSRRVLAELAGRGFPLAIVSNGCGNVDALCRDYGFTPFVSAVVDSRRLGISKPDPRIFAHAGGLLGVPPATTLVVGDSFERDIVAARRAGMMTAWLQPDRSISCPDPSAVDIRLERLEDLLVSLPVPAGH